MKLAIFAPFPPPFGGVSVHAMRLVEQLREAGDDVLTVNVGHPSFRMLAEVIKVAWRRKRLVHYHSDEGNWKMTILLGFVCDLFGTRYVVTLHSFRDRTAFRNVLVRTLLRTTYERAERVICISEHVRDAVRSAIGIDAEQCVMISSTLPMSSSERSAPLPSTVPQTWLDAPVRVLFNVSRLVRYEGKDLYGLDVVLGAWREVHVAHPAARLLVVIATIVDESLYDNALEQLATLQGVDVLTNSTGLLMPYTVASHVVIRATRTEGGPSLTIQEALDVGCVAVASDSVPRPLNTMLFKNEDNNDCARVLGDAVQQVQQHDRPEPSVPSLDIIHRLRSLYEQCTTTERP